MKEILNLTRFANALPGPSGIKGIVGLEFDPSIGLYHQL
jgi:hypothetical protein